MTGEILGGCLCGGVRYRFTGEPLAYYACHCTDCQRQTGSAFGLSMIVHREAVEVLRGEPRLFEVSMPDGRTKRGRCCPECPVRLWGEPVKLPQLLILRPGTFDDPGVHEPFGDIWTQSARPWVGFTRGPRFEGQPKDPTALFRAWQERESAQG
jgi:hypothetical protein